VHSTAQIITLLFIYITVCTHLRVPAIINSVADTEIFRLTGRPGSSLTSADAIDWLGKVIPSFNRYYFMIDSMFDYGLNVPSSHAVESQLPQLNPEIVADNM
jgi:hypothetical protein